jgi:hypothetical protein
MTTVNEKYALYLLHLVVEMMSGEMQELVRYGVSPNGIGYMQPLRKDLQEKMLSLFEKIDVLVRDATVKMIEKAATPGNEEQVTEWIRAMLTKTRVLASMVGDTYGVERDKIMGLINDAEKILRD